MGKCIDCGKSGMFVTVDNYELCRKCASSINGMIRYHNLISFWLSLTPLERKKCINNYDNVGISTGNEATGLVKGSIANTSQSKSALLDVIGANLTASKEYILAEKLLKESLKCAVKPLDFHFGYNHLIDLCYKMRESGNYLDECIKYCKLDIALFPKLIASFQNKLGGVPPSIPAFPRLAIIYEKQGKFEEALEICDLAIKYNISDGTKSDFIGRREKLLKKIKQIN